ncbi:hypothetical protein HC251_18160 [Iamia sp. SCSIO 61187]|uniref:hypothetical protein n=1 Tax=Iamia sp. SCSIO 61187 TaxID=2722752 RepID=UPI001C62F11D|nr:hypothetical protein [Iamia sp. SCSIO 61187]QYG94176.1 hypothetical protein HC251_18160 [Iamia sp. SCSIO 61187]
MSSPGDRHRRGPGGPSRPARSGRVTPSQGRRHRPQVSGLLDPTVDHMVTALLDTAITSAPPDHPARGVSFELWAAELAASSFADEAMPRAFYVDLGDRLAASARPEAPPALAALALAVEHRDATPLRRARDAWLARVGDGADADLGIGREVPSGAVTIGHPDEAQTSVVVGLEAAGGAHSFGLLVDDALDGLGRDLFVGPPLEVIAADAADDPELVVTPIALDEARRRIEDALAVTLAEDWDDPQDLRTLPLVTRRLGLLPPG